MSSSPVACQHLNASECVTASSTSIPVNGDQGTANKASSILWISQNPSWVIYESATTFSIVPQTETRIGTTVAS
jgi:hypothetical protein